ncbi:cytochrome P450 [Nocardia jiangxiensis]|uniref:Cytochrome P450 n=1 Tax=Nocardia jiangxiensis TaxID=282685 RepID=A0ABW6SE71_9NOCA|nr:cytochrome P450 [Nocardia jiangxiensis]
MDAANNVDLRDAVRIEDPAFYLDDPWTTFDRMRREAPAFYYESLDTFVLTRYADIRDVVSKPEVFRNREGQFLNDVKYKDQLGDTTMTDSFFPKGGEQVGTTDGVRHQDLRRVLAPAFSASAMEAMSGPIAEYTAELLDEVPVGEAFDWSVIATNIPIRAGSNLIGLPAADHDRVLAWSEELEKLGGNLTFEELQAAVAEFASLQRFIIENIEHKRAHPGDADLLTVLLDAELHNDKVSQANVVTFAMTMLAAGSDTTRSLLNGLVYHFARNPDQWDALRADRSLVPLAVEETLRMVTPARAFVRTAAEDHEIAGQTIREGQHLYLVYMAANRDETVFSEPHRFDVTRKEAVKHLAFGGGAHVCAGSRLVRLEAPIVLNGLLDRFSRIEPAADPVPVMHVVRSGWETMPVVLHV